MTDFTPSQLARMDTQRLANYRTNLDFYNGSQWQQTSRHRQLVFNYAKVSIDKLTSFLMPGLGFACYPGEVTEELKSRACKAEQLLRQVYDQNNLQQLDYETEIDTAILGDGCYKVIWDTDEKRIRITAPDVSGIYAWWLGDDTSRVWRVASQYRLTRDEMEMLYSSVIASEAKQSQGIATSPRFIGAPRNDRIMVTELWTEEAFDLYLGNDLIEARPNPYGFIPFIIFPNLREPKKFWGISDIPSLVQPQRELNRALSQLSRILELSGNPIAVLENIASAEDIKVQPGALWTIPEDAKAYLLDLLQGGGVRLHVDYIELLYRALHDVSEMPRAAWGGIERELSGTALRIELGSLIQKVMRKRTILLVDSPVSSCDEEFNRWHPPFAQYLWSPDGEDVTYEYPDCHLPKSAQSYETNRIIAVEKFTGITAYTRPLTCHMVKGTYWSDTTFTEPKPFLDIAPSYGLRLQSTSDYWWMEKPNGVWRAPRPADSPLDLTKDIVSVQQNVIASPTSGGCGNLIIELDNFKGQYANPGQGTLTSLRFRSEIVLKLGYNTTAGDETSEAGTYWIDSWEYSTNLNQSLFRLNCLDGRGLMDYWSARYQMRWNKDEANPKSVWQILYQLLARVGIKLTNTPVKPQSSAINNLYPDFIVNPGTAGDSTIRKLLAFVSDRLVFRGQEAFTKNPLADEESCYSYKFPSPSGGEGEGAIHTILSCKYSEAVTVSRARAIGRDASDNRILEEALDWDLLALAIDQFEQDYDPNLQITARAQERADAILRQMSLRAERGNLVVPTNVGQELLDVVTVTDEHYGVSGKKYRVQTIQTDYDRRKERYEQTFNLGAP